MNIAIDCRLIGSSGIGTFIENVIPHIVADKRCGFLLIGDRNKLEQYAGRDHCRVLHCTLRSFSMKELLAFPVAEVNRCDAFFTPNFNIPFGIRVPVYATIHDIVFFDTEGFGSALKRSVLKWYIKWALRISKRLFTVSCFSKERVQSYFHTSKDIRVVHNGISQELIDYEKTMPQYGRHGVAFIGNIKKHKGLDTLLDAYERLKKEGIRLDLTIIGRFNFRTRDDAMIERLDKLRQEINIVSDASNQEVYHILSQAELLVSPSLYEGFGIPPLEAMYLGANVIISDIPAYQEVYHDLPVTFFKAGNIEDLCRKIKNFCYYPHDVKTDIMARYSYERTAKAILSTMYQDFTETKTLR